jgi:hypothetical protein
VLSHDAHGGDGSTWNEPCIPGDDPERVALTERPPDPAIV